ncbi:MAG: hypothetical protein HZY74_07520 [Brevundimonas sp.]|nr:MAG: hypothetical protein HZY74_07520 [Brevundimonas sp.]
MAALAPLDDEVIPHASRLDVVLRQLFQNQEVVGFQIIQGGIDIGSCTEFGSGLSVYNQLQGPRGRAGWSVGWRRVLRWPQGLLKETNQGIGILSESMPRPKQKSPDTYEEHSQGDANT